MRDNYFDSETPSFARAKAYNYNSVASFELYNEIMNIAKEIELCRASV